MEKIPVYKIGHENTEEYVEVVELQERNSYDASKPHRHAYIEVFLFNRGGGMHEIDFTSYAIETNSVHFVFPNQVHKVARELDTYGHVVLISREFIRQLDYDLFVQLFYKFYLAPCTNATSEEYSEMEQCIASVKSELLASKPGYIQVVKGYLTVLFNQMLRFSGPESQVEKQDTRDFKLYMDLLLLVEDHFTDHAPVAFYSSKLSVSERKLNDVCKRFNNSTCSSIVNDRLVLEAKRLLLYSNRTVKDILYTLNFKDPAYFNRFFKARTGHSPTGFVEEFAKKYKK